MNYRLTFTILGTLMTLCATVAAEGDVVKKKLDSAKMSYEADMEKCGKAIEEWFGKREDVARKDGNKKLVDQIKAERQSYKENGVMSKATPMELRKKGMSARTALEVAYTSAIKEYTRAKEDDKATLVEQELAAFIAEAASVERKKWVHDKGSFTLVKPGEWEEVFPNNKIQFKEMARTDQYVELEKMNGEKRVKLYKAKCDVADRPFTKFDTYYFGKWSR